jgi:hypothetical protein
MAINGMRKTSPKVRKARHINLDEEQRIILEAIGETMGKRRLGVRADRSQLIFSAVRNFIDDCRADEDLRQVIDDIRKNRG